MTDDLLRRLQAANPVPPSATVDFGGRTVDDLVEAVMSTDLQSASPAPSPEGSPSPHRSPRRRWIPAAVVTAAALAAVGVGATALIDRGQPPVAAPEPKPLTLTLPGPEAAMQICIAFSVETLRPMPVAFSGTATQVSEQSVTLDVDRWYKGGSASTVRLLPPGDGYTALLESVEFVKGQRYLVTATGGNVNICGFSSEWSADKAAAFEEAFS